jgi:hypothetical protein
MRRVPSVNPNTTVHRERDQAAFGRLLLLLVIALMCAGGFVLAARQHVSAVRMGYRTEELRQERDKLRASNDQLKRSRDEVLAPENLTAAAEKIGLRSATVRQFETQSAHAPAKRPAPDGEAKPTVAAKKKSAAKR